MASVVTSPLKISLVLTHSGWVYTKIKFVENNLIFPGRYLIQLRKRPVVPRACYPPWRNFQRAGHTAWSSKKWGTTVEAVLQTCLHSGCLYWQTWEQLTTTTRPDLASGLKYPGSPTQCKYCCFLSASAGGREKAEMKQKPWKKLQIDKH